MSITHQRSFVMFLAKFCQYNIGTILLPVFLGGKSRNFYVRKPGKVCVISSDPSVFTISQSIQHHYRKVLRKAMKRPSM